MRFTKNYIAQDTKQWCSTNVCFSELYDDCHGMWDKVLKAWQIDEPDFTPMLGAAVKACPNESLWAKLHASTHVEMYLEPNSRRGKPPAPKWYLAS
ncbi:MAG: hypothetical protein CMJ52_02245 [Planctomycetaceae bacterium]|nr:hypothetical protein [Planctomycetaceae bacterium]